MSSRRGHPPKLPAKRAVNNEGAIFKYLTVNIEPIPADRAVKSQTLTLFCIQLQSPKATLYQHKA